MGEHAHDHANQPSAVHAAVVALISRLPSVDEERVRWVRRTTNQVLASGGAGFTLVEMLVVIVILGVLGGVVALTVGSIQEQSRVGACAIERSGITAALESYRVGYGSYPTEAQLVSAGLLHVQSPYYDVSVQGDNFTLTPTGTCASVAPTTTTAGAPTTTTVAPPTTTTVAPTTTTTAPLASLILSSTCTPGSHWPGERAWRIYNPNSSAVSFTLEELGVSHGSDNPLNSNAAPGYTTWYLPAASYSINIATLVAAGDSTWAFNANDVC